MSAIAKQKTNIFEVFKSLFSSEPDIEDYEDIKLPEELNNALKALSVKEKKAEQGINAESNSSSKRGGFGKKIDPKTEQAMRAMHNQVKQQSVEDKEIEL